MNAEACLVMAERLRKLAEQYGLPVAAKIDPQDKDFISDCCHVVEMTFPRRSVWHTMEQGESPSGIYPRMLDFYAQATNGEFRPRAIEADSDDDWDSVELAFEVSGKRYVFLVREVEGSDYFTPTFVPALNRLAKKLGLSGRWVAFYNGDDACSSLYVPLEAYPDFRRVKARYSKE